ncbi:hypothetical protein D9M68_717590 [compost metagenome]
MTVASPVLEYDRVDGAEPLRVGSKIIEMGDHRLLAGVGDVEAREPFLLGIGKQARQVVRCRFEFEKIDHLILIAEPLCRTFRHVHRRGQRGLNARADETGLQGSYKRFGHGFRFHFSVRSTELPPQPGPPLS